MSAPSETDLIDLIPPEAELVRRIMREVQQYPHIRRPLLRFLQADDFDELVALVKENAANIELILERLGVVEQAVARIPILEQRVEHIEEAIKRIPVLEQAVLSIRGTVGRLRGDSYELKCAEQIDAVLDGYVDRAVVANRERINILLREARYAGLISRAKLQDGYNVDIIARAGDDGDETGMLAVAEASITFNHDDLETAARRAELIKRITGVATVAYLVTHHDWPAAMDTAAGELGVTIVQYALPQYAEV